VRIKLTFAATEPDTRLPVDYQHLLSGLIYSTLRSVANDFAGRLHDLGYESDGRRFKLFTFSRLKTKGARLAQEHLVLEDPEIELLISSPVGEFIEHLVNGFSSSDGVIIGDGRFQIISLDQVPAPVFKERMYFRALSPITMSCRREGEHDRFLSLADEWSELISGNLAGKYKALHRREPVNQRVRWRWDQEYVAMAERRGKRLSSLKKFHGIDVKGWLAPFMVEGSRELIELGYEAGFGARNSMGFGMAEVD